MKDFAAVSNALFDHCKSLGLSGPFEEPEGLVDQSKKAGATLFRSFSVLMPGAQIAVDFCVWLIDRCTVAEGKQNEAQQLRDTMSKGLEVLEMQLQALDGAQEAYSQLLTVSDEASLGQALTDVQENLPATWSALTQRSQFATISVANDKKIVLQRFCSATSVSHALTRVLPS